MAIARIETDGIEDGAIDTTKILDGILGTADIPNDSLTNTKFSNSAAIPTSKLSGLATSATTDTTNATNITSGSLATARVNVGTIAGKILQVDGSGNMPALDGSQLTGVESFTKSASDPTVSTNPSTGVGTEWVNTTNGEIYICTDATAGANVWTNVGAGSGDVVPAKHYHDGSNYGYVCGGDISDSAPMATNVIDRFAHASSANATDVGDLSKIKSYPAGALSSTHGYTMGGWNYIPGEGQPNGGLVDIDKFSFASATTNASNIGDLTVLRYNVAGNTSTTHGYGVGGWAYPGDTPTGYNIIEKFPYATDSDATDVGDTVVTGNIRKSGSSNSETHGYQASGNGSSSPYPWYRRRQAPSYQIEIRWSGNRAP